MPRAQRRENASAQGDRGGSHRAAGDKFVCTSQTHANLSQKRVAKRRLAACEKRRVAEIEHICFRRFRSRQKSSILCDGVRRVPGSSAAQVLLWGFPMN